jgi:hypothetical protein
MLVVEEPFSGYAHLSVYPVGTKETGLIMDSLQKGNPRKLKAYRVLEIADTFKIATFLPHKAVEGNWFKFESPEELDKTIEMLANPLMETLLDQQSQIAEGLKKLSIVDELLIEMIKYPCYIPSIVYWIKVNTPTINETRRDYFYRYRQTCNGNTTHDFELFNKYVNHYHYNSFK